MREKRGEEERKGKRGKDKYRMLGLLKRLNCNEFEYVLF